MGAERIDAILAPWSGKRPGVVVVVVRDGDIAFAKGYGLADIARDTPFTPDSIVPFDSLTKQLTGAAIMRLEQRGALNYDDELARFIPEIHAPGVTLRRLLQHRSGLPDLTATMQGGTTLADIVAAYAASTFEMPRDPPFLYNNAGYALLAAVIERVSGTSYADFIRREVLLAAGMRSTHMATRDGASQSSVRMYRSGKPFEAPIDEQPPGGGGLVGSAMELGRWYRALDAGQVAADYEQVVHGLAPRERPDGHEPAYAAGWVLGASGDLDRWSHGGSWRGSKNYVLRYPQRKLTVILVANSFEFGAHRHQVAYRIAKIFLPELDVVGPTEGPVSDACVTYRTKRASKGPLVIDGAEDIRAWQAHGQWMHDPWPYGSDLRAGPMQACR